MNNSNNLPKMLDRKDIILLSESIECPCGRTKERVHCPLCGKLKMYAMADTMMAIIPNSQDIVKNCKMYRCLGCGEKFNDVDWYFNCHAPKKIDIAATKKLYREKLTEEWLIRIEQQESGQRFSWNDRAKCKAETGFDPDVLQQQVAMVKKLRPAVGLTKEQKIVRLLNQINNQVLDLNKDPSNIDIQDNIALLQQRLKELENEQ